MSKQPNILEQALDILSLVKRLQKLTPLRH